MEKADILEAIRQCAKDNGGVPVGIGRFEAMTGIRQSAWLGRYWARWGDAVREAGLEPNSLQAAYSDEAVFDALADPVKELGRYPTRPELQMRRNTDPTFPSHNVWTRFGDKSAVAARLVEHCGDDPNLADVAALARAVAEGKRSESTSAPIGDATVPGVVYLIKSGDRYKIGMSTSPDRRINEFARQFPDPVEVVHLIPTDDVRGVGLAALRRTGLVC